jgi:hypothetical protein
MTFFHFTHAVHLPTILETGYLKTTESNVSFSVDNAGPQVVWLLDQAEPEWSEDMAHGLYPAKRQIRFEVDVPAIKWTNWVPAAQMSRIDRAVLIKGGGGIEAAEHWYVFPARIFARRWVSVTDMTTAETVAR